MHYVCTVPECITVVRVLGMNHALYLCAGHEWHRPKGIEAAVQALAVIIVCGGRGQLATASRVGADRSLGVSHLSTPGTLTG